MTKSKRYQRNLQQDNVNTNRVLDPDLPKGLLNFGNVCYFNSLLQCLSRVTGFNMLLDRLMYGENKGVVKRLTDKGSTISLDLSLSFSQSPLSATYSALVSDLRGSANKRSSISAMPLHGQFVKSAPRFDRLCQNDSHEALRALLSGLKEEEKANWKSAIVKKINATPETSSEARAWIDAATLRTAVERIFCGVMLASLVCKECDHISINFEVFFDISLPILTDDLDIVRQQPSSVSQPKTKREMKRERKAKEKSRRRERDSKFSNQFNGLDDEIDPGQCKQGKKNRRNKKGKPKKLLDDEFDDLIEAKESSSEKSDISEDLKPNDVCSPIGEEETFRTAPTSPATEKRQVLASDEMVDAVGNGNNSFIEIVASTRYSEGIQGLEPYESFVSAKEESMMINHQRYDDVNSTEDVKNCEKQDVEENGNCLSSPNTSERSNSKDSATGSGSTGENADVEDNVENDNDNDCCFSDGSVGPETLLCEDLSSKLCVVPAGDETTIAKPDEEAEAKSVAICPMLPTPGLTDLEYLLAKFTEPIDLNGSNQVVCQRCTDRAGGKDKKAVLCDSVKRDLIFLVPSVLTLHLKRYQHCGRELRKCSKRVSFPIYLDMRPYCSRLAPLSPGEGQYRLFGVVEHSGSLNNGHYVSYVAEGNEIPEEKYIPSLEKPYPWPLSLHHLVCQLRRGDKHVVNGSEPYQNGDVSGDVVSDRTDSRAWFLCSDTHVTRVPVSKVLSAQAYLLFYQRIR